MWINNEKNNWQNISLHDSRVIKIINKPNKITFIMAEEGFWILKSHPLNNYRETMRALNTEFYLLNGKCVKISLYGLRIGYKIIKKNFNITWEKLCKKVNFSKWDLEIIEEKYNENIITYTCCIHRKKKILFECCEIMFSFNSIHYQWNEINPEYTW